MIKVLFRIAPPSIVKIDVIQDAPSEHKYAVGLAISSGFSVPQRGWKSCHSFIFSGNIGVNFF